MMDFHGFPAIGRSSECQNEPRFHNTVNQCYEFWVHSDIANSFWLPENNENPSYKSPRISTIFGVVIINLFVNIYQIYFWDSIWHFVDEFVFRYLQSKVISESLLLFFTLWYITVIMIHDQLTNNSYLMIDKYDCLTKQGTIKSKQ